MSARLRRTRVALLTGVLLLGFAGSAGATELTLKRGVTNLLFGPLDVILSPIVGPRSVYQNLQDIDDTTGVRIFYAVPGVVWNTTFNACGGFVRTVTGIMEIPVGILLLPFEADMDPIFAPPERASALIDEETHLAPIKIGINYMSLN